MVFNDTPANDYISLAATIDRFLQDPETRQSARKLMPLMAPQSYYQQIVPEASVDVGFSTATLHWIGRLQPTAPDWLPADADVAAEVLADICCFLRSRHREVRRGGHLLLSFPVAGALSLECAYPSIFQCLHDLSRDGVISPDAASHFRLPFHFRTAAEIQQALDAVRAEWAVVEHFTLDVDHPAFLQFHATLPEGPDAVPDALALQAYSQAISAGFVAIIGNTVVDTAKRFPLAVDAPAALALGSHPEAVIREQMAARLQERLQQSTFWQTPLGNKYVFLKLRKI
ncbi:hypothetical protein P175DRAFT_0501320 [Aspergillus ochraceoroseus IBT 24754]|nr:uncharacterized protein P175DRAFT_0501320 [Aspergillus ochraceoroseus IBT 24754]PTU20697.1 hypothetical protein P175DRAFT_0501320 [Aspergillus ochraceoroseus IBT 24754]